MERKLFHTLLNNTIVITAFCVLIVAGFNFSAKTLLDEVGSASPIASLWYLFSGSICFTPSNAALLAIVSAYIGAEVNAEEYDIAEHWRLAIARGLLVFTITFAASAWFNEETIINQTQESYFKLAFAVATAALAAGYDPTRIGTLLKSDR